MRYSDSVRVMLNKAKGSYLSASSDMANGIFDRAVSSLYYSAFQTVTALIKEFNMAVRSLIEADGLAMIDPFNE